MLRFSVAIAISLFLTALRVQAFTPDQLQLEFDARRLTEAEKRFLQVGLAFANDYNGLLDGAWGSASQRALERYELKHGRPGLVTNGEVLLLALDTYGVLEKNGWVRQYNSTLDMSFLVPTIGFITGTPSANFLNMELTGTSLRYSLTIGNGAQTERLHQFTAKDALGDVYRVRRSNLWITSARTPNGSSLYTRSDYRRGSWSSILLSAIDSDAGALAAVTGSIEPGYSPQIGISSGVLAAGIETMAAMLDEGSPSEAATSPDGFAASNDNADGQEAKIQEEKHKGFGTGFLVSANGDFLTNSHVVDGCGSLSIDGVSAIIIAQDEAFDLALLRIAPAPDAEPARFAQKPARLNSDVTVIGYPLPDLLGGLNVTRGSVTSLKGIAGDGVRMQISAPVQPGNSGGPVVNAAGQIVGVVVSKLDAQMVADATGDIPQNINFAIRAEIAKLFLYQSGVEPMEVEEQPALSPEEIAEFARRFTRLITCN